MKRCAYSHSYAELTVRGHHRARGELTAKHLTLFSRVAIRDKRSDCRRQRDYHVSTCPVRRGTRTYSQTSNTSCLWTCMGSAKERWDLDGLSAPRKLSRNRRCGKRHAVLGVLAHSNSNRPAIRRPYIGLSETVATPKIFSPFFPSGCSLYI
jgi:hypothetical protein